MVIIDLSVTYPIEYYDHAETKPIRICEHSGLTTDIAFKVEDIVIKST